nr:Chain C, Melanocyte protein PMEL [Homo sapiens]
ILDQVPFSV